MTPERRTRLLRLVPAAASAWAAAALCVCLPDASGWVAACGVGATAVGIVLVARTRRAGAAVFAVAGLAVAVVAAHVVIAQPGRDAVGQLVPGSGRAVVVDAVVAGKLEATSGGEVWFDALAQRVSAGERTLEGLHPVRVGVSAAEVPALAEVDIGTSVSVHASTIPRDVGERAGLVLRAHRVEVAGDAAAAPLALASSLRRSLVSSASTLPAPGAALVPGLAVGDTSAVDAALDAQMKASSLSHLTAVSGANCALVVGIAYGAAALCGARRGMRVAVALVTLGGFVLLVTPEPSVVRAGAMAAIAMLALALGRAGAGLSVLCLAVVTLLAVDPWLSVSLGFALSTVATSSLLVVARPLAAGLSRWMPRPLALGLSVPLAAQLACGPLLVLVDPHVPLLGVVANLLAAPAAPLATLAGFAACLFAPLPWVQDGLAGIAWLPASWIAGIAQTVASFPGQRMPWLDGMMGVAALAAVSAGVVVVVAGGTEHPGRRMFRVIAGLVLAVVVGVGGGQSVLRTVAGPLTLPAEWAVAACEIGQGDAVLVRSRAAVALIDTGPDPALLRACLDRFGVSQLDLLVLTHFDLDHVGGLAAVVGRVSRVVHGPPDGSDAQRELDSLAAAGAELHLAEPSMQGLLGDARWRVLWPPSEAAPGNDASVVVDVRGGALPTMLFLGDLSAEAQRGLQRANPLGRYDVVKVAHHGSADQDARLYAMTHPVVGLIPVGQDNDYGHPRDSLLSTLTSLGTAVARTDENGVVAAWKDEAGYVHVWREREVGADH
ncbi:ComEC/Rec2 family competence protein [Microbacterium sp. P04]|uniref:ComEC/Rec2 family competence protein n=1 Tax=Microbacterium sp. P04 TaxID=3366947 RepID=UPI003746FECE